MFTRGLLLTRDLSKKRERIDAYFMQLLLQVLHIFRNLMAEW